MQSVIKGDEPYRCYICGCYGEMQVHHMLHGIHRQAADHYGLTVHLCPACHAALHDHGHLDRFLEQEAQRTFEHIYNHSDFMKIFGKNWL